MVNDTQFKGCKETLRKILADMAFRYKKYESNRKFLMEQNDILARRVGSLLTFPKGFTFPKG